MAKAIVQIKDVNQRRIVIPQEVWSLEGLQKDDYIEIDVKKHGGWDCRKKIFTEEYYNNVKVDPSKNPFAILFPGATTNKIIIPTIGEYGIEFNLKDTGGSELPDSVIISLWTTNRTSYISSTPTGNWLEDCTYGEFKRKFKPRNDIFILPSELLAVYIKESEYIKKGIRPENIRFTVDLCTKR